MERGGSRTDMIEEKEEEAERVAHGNQQAGDVWVRAGLKIRPLTHWERLNVLENPLLLIPITIYYHDYSQIAYILEFRYLC